MNRKTREEEEEEELQRAIALSLQMTDSPVNYGEDEYEMYQSHVKPSPSPAAGGKPGARAHDGDDDYSQKSTKSRKVNGDSHPSKGVQDNSDFVLKGVPNQKSGGSAVAGTNSNTSDKFPIQIIAVEIENLFLSESEAKEALSYKKRESIYNDIDDDDYDLYNCGVANAIRNMHMMRVDSDDDEYGC